MTDRNDATSASFKYDAIYNWVTDGIVNGALPYNSKLPSEAQLSAQFQVSRQTVRNALKRLATNGYIQSIKGSGSYVLKRTRTRTKKIGIMFTSISGYICADIFSGLEKALTERGYRLHLELSHDSVENERRFLEEMLNRNMDGVVLEATKSGLPTPNEALFRKLTEAGIPYVFVNSYYSNVPANAVVWDDENVAYKLTKHLIESGRRNIGCFFRFDEIQGMWRYLGYARALRESGIAIDEQNICWYSINNETNFISRNASNIDYTLDCIVKNCSALICYNDLIVGSLITKLRARNVAVPEQMTIVSFDNSDLVQFFGIKDFLSFDHPKERLGHMAAMRLLDCIHGNCTEPQVLVVPSAKQSEIDK